MKTRSSTQLAIFALLFSGLLLGAAASAGAPPARQEKAASVKVYLDPKTGQILTERPRNPEWYVAISPEIAQALRTDAEGLTREILAGGGSRVNLEGRFQAVTVATVEPDGTVTERCLTGAAGAANAAAKGKAGRNGGRDAH